MIQHNSGSQCRRVCWCSFVSLLGKFCPAILLFIPEVYGDEYKKNGQLSDDNPNGRAGEEEEKGRQPLKQENESENY